MLIRLKVNTSQHASFSNDMNQNECEFIKEPGSLEWVSVEAAHSEISVSPDNSEIILKNDSAEDPAYFKLATDFQESTPPLIVGTREQASSFLHNSMKEAGQDLQPSKSPPEPDPEEGTSQTKSIYDNLKGSPDQQPHGPLMHRSQEPLPPTSVCSFIKGTTVSKKNEIECRPPPSKPPRSKLKSQGCNLNVEWKGTDEVGNLANKDNHMAKKELENENPTSKSTQSVSDVGNSSRRDRSVSDPNWPRKADMYVKKAQESPEQEAEAMDCDSENFKSQKKVRIENKMKMITQKLMRKLKEKSSPVQSSSPSNHHDGDETQSVTSVEEKEPPARAQPSPLPSPKEESPTRVKVSLQRTFTLRDFTLTLEPINLLEEVLIGEEWASFLPVKDEPLQAEANNQSQMEKTINLVGEIVIGDRPPQAEDDDFSQTEDSCHLNDYMTSQNLDIKQGRPSNEKQSITIQSEKDQVNVNDSQLDRVRQGEKESCIFAVPKALIINGAIKQKKPKVPGKDDDVYDVVEVIKFPNNITDKRMSKDFLLEFSAVKSLGVLDNSALKSRIQLSRKRKHRPPKLRRKGRTEVTQNVIDSSHASTISSPSESTWTSSVFASSVFYSLPPSSLTPDSEDSLIPALSDKQKAKEGGGKPKIWKLKT